jgi:hypothetical protein
VSRAPRAEPRACTADELERLNQREHRARGGAFQPWEVERGIILESKLRRRPARELAERWAHHPDERVVAQAVQAGIFLGAHLDLRAYVLHRGMQDEALWNPLLDAVGVSFRWRATEGTVSTWARDAEVDFDSQGERLRQVAAWAASEPDPEAYRGLDAFSAPPFWRTIAEESAALGPDLLEMLFTDPSRWRGLLQNPACTDEVRLWLEERAREILRRPEYSSKISAVFDHVQLMVAARAPFSEGLVDDLIACLHRHAETDRVHYRQIGSRDRWDAWPMNALIERVGAVTLNDAQQHALYEYLLHRPESRAHFVWMAHGAGAALAARLVVEQARVQGVREALAQNPVARRAPAVRAVLKRSSSVSVLEALCADAAPAEFRTLLRRLGRQAESRQVARVLREASPEQRGALRAEDLAQLLASPDAELRLAAVAALSARPGGLAAPAVAVEPADSSAPALRAEADSPVRATYRFSAPSASLPAPRRSAR